MLSFEDIFENRSFDKGKLLAFGFVPCSGGFAYTCKLSVQPFELKVIVRDSGKVTADIFDSETSEKYVLVKVPAATGNYVGKIRAECEEKLARIAQNCFFPDAFKSLQAKRLIAYVRSSYGSELEFLWDKLPLAAVIRRKDNAKWYAVFMNVSRSKLGLPDSEPTDMINLKIESSAMDSLIDGKNYFPGYHMNKKHWFSVCLDGSVPYEDICRHIDRSYALAGKK